MYSKPNKIIATSVSGNHCELTVKRTGEDFSAQHLRGVQFFDGEGNLAENLKGNQVRLRGERYALPSDWSGPWSF